MGMVVAYFWLVIACQLSHVFPSFCHMLFVGKLVVQVSQVPGI